jgi:hypothetical protein
MLANDAPASPYAIYFVIKILSGVDMNYIVTENEFLSKVMLSTNLRIMSLDIRI